MKQILSLCPLLVSCFLESIFLKEYFIFLPISNSSSLIHSVDHFKLAFDSIEMQLVKVTNS